MTSKEPSAYHWTETDMTKTEITMKDFKDLNRWRRNFDYDSWLSSPHCDYDDDDSVYETDDETEEETQEETEE